jgi:hypothetical protein
MSIVSWGVQPKSQFDNETIEEAIARLIAVHEADEASHLGVGESLQSHKASSIIDHLAASIVEDKIGNGQVTIDKLYDDKEVIRPSLESLDGWNIVKLGAGCEAICKIGSLQLYVDATLNDYITAYAINEMSYVSGYDNPVLQCRASFYAVEDNADAIVSLGASDPFSPDDNLGFRYDKSDDKFYCFYNQGGVETKFEITGVALGGSVTLRIEVLDSGNTLNFYVNGVLKKTYSSAGFTMTSQCLFSFAVKNCRAGWSGPFLIGNIIFIKSWS